MNQQDWIKNEIGKQVRYHRLKSAMTAEEVAAALVISRSKLTKLETGLLRPTPEFIAAVSRVIRIPKPEKDALVAASRSLFSQLNPWQMISSSGLRGLQRYALEQERETRTLKSFQLSVIPGLLQTREYARRVFELSRPTSGKAIDQAVELRTERQKILENERKEFAFLLAESAVRFQICQRGEMEQQIEHLIENAQRRNVTVGILPFDEPIPVNICNSFIILDHEVHVETETADLIIADASSVRKYRHVVDALQRNALTGTRFIDFLSRLKIELRRKGNK
jgi:transcriptional regulator with XRE-family HTH domain